MAVIGRATAAQVARNWPPTPGQFVPSPKNRTPRPWRLQSVANRPEESGPLRAPRQIAARATYKIPPRTSSAPSPIRNILGLSILSLSSRGAVRRLLADPLAQTG